MRAAKVVIDTNVVVSAHLRSEGYERYVVDLALAEKLRWFVSPSVLEEYSEVLRRAKFGFRNKDINHSIALIRKHATMVHPVKAAHACKDPDDDRFLECAAAAGAAYLVTGNLRHFPAHWKQTVILDSRSLVEILVPHLER